MFFLVIFHHFSAIDSLELFWMLRVWKNIKCWCSSRLHSWSDVFPIIHWWSSWLYFFCFICDTAIYTLDATARFGFWTWICTLDSGRKRLVDFSVVKSNLFFFLTCFIQITVVLFMWKWMGLSWIWNILLRCLYCLSLLNWIGALTSSLLLKL